MTPDEIHDYCTKTLGAFPPKVVVYHNGTLVALRNGDGDRVATMLDKGAKPEAIKEALASLYKIKAGNTPSKDTMAKFMKSADEIRAHQEAKKPQEPKRDFGVKPEKWLDL